MGSVRTRYQGGEKKAGSDDQKPKKAILLIITTIVFLGFLYQIDFLYVRGAQIMNFRFVTDP